MTTTADRHRYSEASLLCEEPPPAWRLATSTDAGWTSLLLKRYRCERTSGAFETRETPDQTIVAVVQGQCEMEAFGGGTWRKAVYQPGAAGMRPGGETSRLRWTTRGPATSFQTVHLYVPQSFFQDAAEHFRKAGQPYRERPLSALVFNDPTVSQAISSLLDAMGAGAPDLYAQSALQWMAIHLLSLHCPWFDGFEDRGGVGSLSEMRLARVVEYMGEHFAGSLSLKRLASEAGISKFHFARMFKERTGLTPFGYVLKLRMDTARRLLATTDLSVSDVAAACGYERPAHFAAAFSRRFSASPTAFRARTRRRHAAG